LSWKGAIHFAKTFLRTQPERFRRRAKA
jgi:hypothetical protein